MRAMNQENELTLQRTRVERIANSIKPKCQLEFLCDTPPGVIEFRIQEKLTGEVLVPRSGHCKANDLARQNDRQLQEMLTIMWSVGRVSR